MPLDNDFITITFMFMYVAITTRNTTEPYRNNLCLTYRTFTDGGGGAVVVGGTYVQAQAQTSTPISNYCTIEPYRRQRRLTYRTGAGWWLRCCNVTGTSHHADILCLFPIILQNGRAHCTLL
jgi:hypothetical protein